METFSLNMSLILKNSLFLVSLESRKYNALANILVNLIMASRLRMPTGYYSYIL